MAVAWGRSVLRGVIKEKVIKGNFSMAALLFVKQVLPRCSSPTPGPPPLPQKSLETR